MPAIGTRGSCNCAHGCLGIRFAVPIPDLDAMPATVACALSRGTTYDRRQPERTLLYRTVQAHLATWLALQDDGSGASAPAVTEREFRRDLECGILAHGFARARCGACGHDTLIAYSCKGRGVCPSCTTRRMVETAAHLADHVIPRLPVRQWVLSVPERPRYHLQHGPTVLGGFFVQAPGCRTRRVNVY